MYLRDWIEIDINNLVQIACHDLYKKRVGTTSLYHMVHGEGLPWSLQIEP